MLLMSLAWSDSYLLVIIFMFKLENITFSKMYFHSLLRPRSLLLSLLLVIQMYNGMIFSSITTHEKDFYFFF